MSCGVVNPYMNKRADAGCAYEPTRHEQLANIATHGLAILPSIIMTQRLLSAAYRPLQYQLMLLYGICTTLLFVTSSLYHCCELLYRPNRRILRYYLHITDRAVIYFFIAATATPWLSLRNCHYLGTHLKWIMWMLALFGIGYQLKYHEKHKTIETMLYVIVGLVPHLAVFTMEDKSGLPLVLLGGGIYAVGVLFFKLDGVVPFAHALWHLHVVMGAAVQAYAVYAELIGPNKFNPLPEDAPY